MGNGVEGKTRHGEKGNLTKARCNGVEGKYETWGIGGKGECITRGVMG